MTDSNMPVLQQEPLAPFSTDIVPQGETAAERQGALYRLPRLGLSFTAVPTDALAQARTRGRANPYNPNVLTIGDTQITVTEDRAVKALGVGESKILKAGIQAFTARNAPGQPPQHLRVTLDTVGYARKCGVEITPETMPTPETQAAEDKKAAKRFDNFLDKARRNLRNVQRNAAFSWTETVKGKVQAYSSISFISGYRVTRKSITIDFGLAAAEYLVKRPLRQDPDALYLIDERREEAYAIGDYLNQHYSIDSNVTRGTEGILSIPSILAVTAMPTIDEVRQGKSKRTWQDQIKERFERDLDELTRVGLLSTWAYSHEKKRLLTDAEAAAISSYEEFAELYLCYEIANYPPHGERTKAIAAKTEERKAKRASKAPGRKRKAEGGE